MSSKQLGFELNNTDPFSKKYLVNHSGISPALDLVNSSIQALENQSEQFKIITIVGNEGSGKSHILNYINTELEQKTIDFQIYDNLDSNHDSHSSFISCYEKLKASGGLLLVSVSKSLDNLSPHIGTRLTNAQIVYLGRPQEEEYREILISMMQRENFKLSEKSINYVLSRVPANTLSLKSISVKLRQLFEQDAKSAKFFTIRDIVDSD